LARRAAERALALAPDLAEAHAAMGDYLWQAEANQSAAMERYAAALRRDPKNPELLASVAFNQWVRGRRDSALTTIQRAAALDPRSVNAARRYAYSLMMLHRYPEAEAAQARALGIAPADLTLVQQGAMLALMQGDLERARRIAATPPAGVDPAEHIAYFATYEEMTFLLSGEQLRRLVTLSPAPFGGDRGAWGLSLAQGFRLLGDQARSRAYADSARIAFEKQLRDAPGEPQLTVLLGHALALMGRKAEAVRAGERAVRALPSSKDAYIGPYIQHQLARIHMLNGESEQALDQLEPLLGMPYTLNRAWLRVDPTYEPLRKSPRFAGLAAGDG
jgi:tetratricopeptide (TPR) repeat protein